MTYIVEIGGRYVGPFKTVEAACRYAYESSHAPFTIIELEKPK